MTDYQPTPGDTPREQLRAPAASGFPPPTEQVPALADVIARPVKAGSSSRGSSILMALAAAIAIGGLAFAAGRFTAPAAASSSTRNGNGLNGAGTGQFNGNPGQGFNGASGQGRAFGGGFGGITVTGTVAAVSADSITVKLPSGTSITIPLDSATTYHTAAAANAAAVSVGSTVSVTPGARIANPNGSPNPNASPGTGGFGGIGFGAAKDVTVTAP